MRNTGVNNPHDHSFAKRFGRTGDGLERNCCVTRVQQAVKLRPASVKRAGHGLFGLLLLPHLPFESPGKNALGCDGLDFFSNSVFIEEAIKT